jgi:two-component system cell cycle sensor histidine kinase/response regulator CckA
MLLRSAGHRVVAAANGAEAISLYRYSPDRYDVVLTDLTMPVMGGVELVKLVRQTRPEAKVICMSGYADDALPEGVEFLAKPFEPSELVACVDKVLQQC